jgi:hypothetical protein
VEKIKEEKLIEKQEYQKKSEKQENIKYKSILVYDYDYQGFPINEDIGYYLETPGVYKVIMTQDGNIKTTSIEKL